MATTAATQLDEETLKPPAAAKYDAEQIKLDPNEDTVEGRLAGIIAKNAPLQQLAQSNALQQMNKRGLINSSMAVGAGQRAVIESALPIAQQDASAYLGARTANVGATNRSREFGAGNEQQLTGQQFQGIIQSKLADQDAATRERLLQQQGEIEKGLIGVKAGEERTTLQQQQAFEAQQLERKAQIDTALQELRGGQAETLAQMDNEYRVLLQSSQSASQFYSQVSASMAEILAADLPAESKQALINHQLTLLNGGLKVIGGMANLNLTNLLNFGQGGGTGGTGGTGATPSTGTGLTGNQLAEILDRLRRLQR